MNLTAAAKLLDLNPETLAAHAARGLVPGAKVGRRWVFIEDDLLAHIRGQYAKKAPCHSTSAKAVKSGGRTSVMLGNGYVGQLERLIAQRRKPAATKFR